MAPVHRMLRVVKKSPCRSRRASTRSCKVRAELGCLTGPDFFAQHWSEPNLIFKCSDRPSEKNPVIRGPIRYCVWWNIWSLARPNALKNLDWDEIQRDTAGPIKWKVNPPSGARWGGWWERLIVMTKQLLRRNLGKSCVTYEELNTLITEIEVAKGKSLTWTWLVPFAAICKAAQFAHT